MISIAALALLGIQTTAQQIVVDPKGNDANPGSLAKPLRTLQAAQKRVRLVRAKRPVRVVIRGGQYNLAEPLSFGSEDSGTDAAPVSWEARSGETVSISGGVRVGNWSEVSVNGRTAWVTNLPEVAAGNWYFRSLYGADDERRGRARLGNDSLMTVKSVDEGKRDWLDGRDQFYFATGEMQNWPDANEGEVVMFTTWCDSHMPVKTIDEANRRITFTKASLQNFEAGARYQLENVQAALSRPGDWTLTRKGQLTYLPKQGEMMAGFQLIAPKTQQLLKIENARNLSFRGLKFSHANWWFPEGYVADTRNGERVWGFQQAASGAGAAIEVERSTKVSFEQCQFSHMGANALNIGGASSHISVLANKFRDIGACAIRIGDRQMPTPVTDPAMTRDVVFADNDVVGCGKVFYGAVGVLSLHARRVQIVHNHVADMPYTGISVGWNWGFDPQVPSRDNLIAWNDVHGIFHESIGDGAGIYTLGLQPGTVIENNRVYNIQGHYASRGIYLDDGSSEMVVRNNLAYRNQSANFFQWRSKNNRVYNNVFAFGSNSQIELAGAIFNDGAPALTFERNVVITDGPPLLNAFKRSDVKSIYTIRKNLFWSTVAGFAIPGDLKQVGWDLDSIVANPGFTNPALGDFRLRTVTPALKKIGFVPFNLSTVGPRKK